MIDDQTSPDDPDPEHPVAADDDPALHVLVDDPSDKERQTICDSILAQLLDAEPVTFSELERNLPHIPRHHLQYGAWWGHDQQPPLIRFHRGDLNTVELTALGREKATAKYATDLDSQDTDDEELMGLPEDGEAA